MTLRPSTFFARALVAAVLLAAIADAQTPPRETHRSITTPDGSRFLLVPMIQGSLIHWTILTPAGALVDPPNHPGLAAPRARASLSGTDTVGTRSWVEESQAMRLVERLEAEVANAEANGSVPGEQLETDLARARRSLESVRDTGAWLRELRAAPAIGVELEEYDDSVLFRLTTTTESFANVAYMIMDRRENARLRTLDVDYAAIAAERTAAPPSDRARVHAEIRDLAYYGLGPRDVGTSAKVDRDVATAVYRRTQNPAATYHVIVGQFGLDEMSNLLQQQFDKTRMPVTPPPTPQPRRRSRERIASLDAVGARGAVAIAIEAPADTPSDAMHVLSEWLAGGPDSYLASELRARGFVGLEISATWPFPTSGSPGLMLAEVWQSANPLMAKPNAELLAAVRDRMAVAMNRANWEVIESARRRALWMAQVRYSDPTELGAWLAFECGLRGRPVATALTPATQITYPLFRDLIEQIVVDGSRIVIDLEAR